MIKSFKYAYNGLLCALQERTFKILLIIALVVLLLAVILKITLIEVAVLVLTIIIVLGLELFNSQIEKTFDILKPGRDARIGKIKDIAAASVLIASIGSVLIGMLIFLPRIFAIL